MTTQIGVNKVLMLTTEQNIGFDTLENAHAAAKFTSKNDPTVVEVEVIDKGQVIAIYVNGNQTWSLATDAFI